MATIDVLTEILQWSMDRPAWQRDALRRLVMKGDLDESDIQELSNLCKSRHGLGDRTRPAPLDSTHLPQTDARNKPVLLVSLTHHSGVNALAQNQTVEFSQQLTVVYGANAAGKSGYTRILKRACRARGAEEILGNVVSGAIPGRPSATIKFSMGSEAQDHLWGDDQSSNALLSRVSVFDHHCASVYVAQRTDVAFRPMGLDLFDKLSNGCEAVRKTLEKERDALESRRLRFPNVAEGTAVHELLTDLSSLTDPDSVRGLATLDETDIERMEAVRATISDLQSDDPEKRARESELRANRIDVLVERVSTVEDLLSGPSISELFDARDQRNETRRATEDLHRTTFEEQPLSNTGSVAWRGLWDAAERFSTTDAYPGHAFPFTGRDARCVLCQQELNADGTSRFLQFQEFLSSAIQSEYEEAEAKYRDRHSQFKSLLILDETVTEALEELRLDNLDLSDAVRAYLEEKETRKRRVYGALDSDAPCPTKLPVQSLNLEILKRHVDNLRYRATKLREANRTEAVKELKRELSELEARQSLADHLADVLEEIERKKKIAAYQLCLDETRTNSITRKSSDVTKRAVTEQLTVSFTEELDKLRFRHVEVQMVDAGGSRGALYHKLQLRRAPGVEVDKVVSEGEARCLSIASFFAELSTAEDKSAILFDDPVSSLDHNWRAQVAERLVVESKSRQVIVFTHDIVFLLALAEKADRLGVTIKHQHLRRGPAEAGLSSQELPWTAMKVRGRIGRLKKLCQEAGATYRKGDQGKYEQDASVIYGLLREAWERGVEEVLLGGIVERYRNTIQTQQVSELVDICDADCDALNAGMTKCSKWLPGHDQAAAESEPFPEPDEVEVDIKAFEDWVQRIRKRR